MRVSWDEYFMQIADIVKTRSTCMRRQVGAVIVKDNRIITTGYNGAPSGCRHCTEIGTCFRQEHNIPSGERHEMCGTECNYTGGKNRQHNRWSYNICNGFSLCNLCKALYKCRNKEDSLFKKLSGQAFT